MKRPPFPGVAVASGYRPHSLASIAEIVKSDLEIFNPPGATSRQCPLPSRASSIDLEHPETFMKPDHATSDSASAGLAYSLRGPVRRDRKSTRLNSSHLVISYAVFCLK